MAQLQGMRSSSCDMGRMSSMRKRETQRWLRDDAQHPARCSRGTITGLAAVVVDARLPVRLVSEYVKSKIHAIGLQCAV